MSQHSQCLTGSLQSTLMGGSSNASGDIVSISATNTQPLVRPSSAITTSAQRFSPLNTTTKPTTTGRNQQQQHQKLNTPLLPLSSATASLNAPTANIFFPPLPPRSNGSNGIHSNDGGATANVSHKSSPACSTDINMNVVHERNREHNNIIQQPLIATPAPILVCNSANISPNPARFSTTNSSKSTKLHSPLSVQPTKTFAGFFPEPVTQFTSSNNTSSNNNVHATSTNHNSPNTWCEPLEDNNYHLYHEPIDPDELNDAKDTKPQNSPTESKISSSISVSQSNHAISSPTTWFRNDNRLSNRGDKINNNNTQHQSFRTSAQTSTSSPTSKTTSNTIAKDWTFAMPPSPATPTGGIQSALKQKLSLSGDLQSNQSQNRISSSSSTTFTDRANTGRRNDVSADIYFCYVTLKSNERSNHRSRSYHGPKKITNSNGNSGIGTNNEIADATNPIDSPRTLSKGISTTGHINFSSTSIADLPMSPTAFTSSMTPIHFRDHCLRELIETESNYVHALDMILTCFAMPLEGILKREDHQLIFGYIRDFHHIHSSFQTDIVKAAFRNYNKELSHINTLAKTTNGIGSNTLASTSANNNSNNNSPNGVITGTGSSANTSSHSTQRSPLSSPSAQDTMALKTQNSNNSKANSGAKISCCFLNAKKEFLKYGDYCANLSRAQALLDELTNKNDIVAQKLDRCQQEANEGKFKLRDLLSLPMQRILKYHLLLAQLIKNTNSTNDDYHGLKRAHETMVDLGQYINEVKRDTEAKQIINDIEQAITGLNMPPNTRLTDYGRLVADGLIRIKAPNDSKSTKQLTEAKMKQKRYIFVFDKVMLMCKHTAVRNYQYKEALVLSEYDLEVNPMPSISDFSTLKHATKDKWSHGFNLVRSNDKTVFSFYAKTPEMKNKWVSAILKAMDNTRPTACRNNETNHEFLMHSFDKASSCDHCGKYLLGLYYQGYRCQTCFISVHKRCLTSVRPCGSILPPVRPNSSLTQPRPGRFNEPASPSLTSNCSDASDGALTPLPPNPNSLHHSSNQLRRINLSDLDLAQGQNLEQSTNGYVNFILDEYPWFCGRMERDTAQALLEKLPHGTFLVRVSPRHNGSHVISLNYNRQVKHIRIYVSKDNQLYLSQNRYFKSVIELVSHYKDNSLVESFHMLDARLVTPFKLAQK